MNTDKPWRPGDIRSGMFTPGPSWPIEQIEACDDIRSIFMTSKQLRECEFLPPKYFRSSEFDERESK